MPWPVHPNGLLGAQGDNDTYQISRSLRFNSADSAYLSRTFGTPTNQNVWTLSVWLKGSNFVSSAIFGASSSGVTNYEAIYFNTSSNLLAETWINLPPIQSRNQKTNGIFRDPSAWYHIVASKNGSWASSYPFTIYVNGVSQSLTTFDLNTSFVNRLNSNGVTHQIGADGVTTNLFNGYMSEFQFIDGQALTPSSFGETDAVTGRWKAKAYSGSYGTNGFYLKFADNSSTAALGTDSSGNGNTWTVNNFSVTAGAGNDSLVDSPTNYGSDSGVGGTVRGNYATLNPLQGTGITANFYLDNGNLDLNVSNNSGYRNLAATFSPEGSKGYCEITMNTSPNFYIGFANESITPSNTQYTAAGTFFIDANGDVYNGTTSIKTGCTPAFSSGNTLQIAFDFTGGARNVWFGRNGTWGSNAIGIGIPSTGTNPVLNATNITQATRFYFGINTGAGLVTISANFGQRPFAYTAPSGFKALCTTNLSTPTIKKPSSYMDVVTYTGTGASNSISSLGFSPNLVWIKNRGGATSHALYDTVRGVQAQLSSDTTGSEVTSSTGLTAFSSNGFTIGTSTLVNTSGTQYVAWAWDEAPIAGMDIVDYTGDNNSSRTISHTLGVVPSMIILKPRSGSYGTEGWQVWHKSLSASNVLQLHSTAAQAGTGTFTSGIISSSPTASVFGFTAGGGGVLNVNASSTTYIAYLFAEIEGFSKFGSYTGNASADGPFVYCGFRPRWVLVKRYDGGAENWILHDSARDTYNVTTNGLRPNSSLQEVPQGGIDFVSNGFKIRTNLSDVNASGASMIFAAFAEQPFKYARAR